MTEPQATPRPDESRPGPAVPEVAPGAAPEPAAEAASEVTPAAASVAGATIWHRGLRTPLRQFLHTETGSAAILVAAVIVALIWANAGGGSYDRFWGMRLIGGMDGMSLVMNLRTFVNSGLMTFFFLVVGLEARREWDMGELRVRSRVTLPLLAGLAGMLVPILIYLAFNAGTPAQHGWGTTMSTDTAFALGAIALAGRNLPDRVRTYLLTFSVVDDLAGLAVIAIAYSSHVDLVSLIVGVAAIAAIWVIRTRGVRYGPTYFAVGIVAWIAFYKSGVDPIISGLVIGLLTGASPPAREDLEQATTVFRAFREQPTARFAQETRAVVRAAISPNDRLQELYHPVTSYVIVPLFALANANVHINASFLATAYASPITLGILLGYVAGKPVGTAGAAWLVAKVTKNRLKPPVGWGAVTGAGVAAGTGFTVSLLIASLAFSGPGAATELAEAKLGILSAAICSAALTWATFRTINLLPPRIRLRAMFGTGTGITDLVVPVDLDRDHIRGPEDGALVTLVEYGDFECPYCGQAEPIVRELIKQYGELRFVFRHLPLTDVHPHAQLAAEGAEAAAKQGKFWEMHDMLMDHQGALTPRDLVGYAGDLGLDADKFSAGLRKHVGAARVAEDVNSADLDSVSGTPTFFINGKRHYGAYDLETLKEAVHTAKAIAVIGQ